MGDERTLRLVLTTATGQQELAVACAAHGTTLAELLAAAGAPAAPVVHVDGRAVPTDHTVAEACLPDGAVLHRSSHGAARPRTSARLEVQVVAGTGGGRTLPLDRSLVVGRDPTCDLVLASATVSARHCRLTPDGRGRVVVTDLDSTNGTWVGGVRLGRRGHPAGPGEVVRCGAVVLRVVPVAADVPRGLDPVRHLGPDGRVPFNRPPRAAVRPPVAPVAVPAPPPDAAARQPLQWAALLAPLVLGAVMVVALGSWRYAMFMALSPVLLLATWLSGRRRSRREVRTAGREHAAAVSSFRTGVARAAAQERERRWDQLPSVATCCDRALLPSTRLWERRGEHPDHLRLHAGVGAVAWQPPLDLPSGASSPVGPAAEVLAEWSRLPRSPVGIDLGDGGVVGIVGARAAGVDLARSLLLQAVVHHGPADLDLAVVAGAGHVADWDWTTWLPHAATAGGVRRLAADRAAAAALLAALRAGGDEHPIDPTRGSPAATLLVVVDDPVVLRGRDADARAVLRGVAGPVAGIVLAATRDELPAVCDTVVEVDDDGTATVARPADGEMTDRVLLARTDVARCRDVARRLAGLEDPEQVDPAGRLPRRTDLLALLDVDATDPDAVRRGWSERAGRDPTVPLGVGPDGPVTVDLVADGPHGLLGGTTGAGKSELLRTLVAGLAARHGPDDCTFVLLDYKGGAAFDACADLPHVVGLVTDLDEHLGVRALRSLEAELHHREARLRAAGVSDLAGWGRLPAEDRGDPLPRLLVVVDEFATLRAELPDFVDALIGIAQRGRSLGVHLLLGTQRPSGAISEDVRANTNLRIALRMTDERDSTDVVGVPDAAVIPTDLPGRAVLQVGPRRTVPVQTALATGRAAGRDDTPRVGPVRFGPTDDLPTPRARDEGASDLERLVDACRRAADGVPPPRRPWLPPLPACVRPRDLPERTADGRATIGLLDDPDGQQQVATGWTPSDGNLLLLGRIGSGTTTALATIAVALARTHAPDDLHLHALDLDRGALAPLASLPHCGAVVTATEEDRRERFRHWLLDEVERRRALSAHDLTAAPWQVVLVDGLPAWLDPLDEPSLLGELEAVQRALQDAPGLRIAVVATSPRPMAVRSAVLGAFPERLALQPADPNDLATVGLRPADVPPLPPGRAVRPADGALVQVARSDDLAAHCAEVAAGARSPTRVAAPITGLPELIPATTLRDDVVVGPRRWWLPVGLGTASGAPVGWQLHSGQHALVLGPPGSGRTDVLRALATVAVPHVQVVAVGFDPPAGGRAAGPGDLARLVDHVDGPTLVLVDDADHVSDPGPALAAGDVRLVAAARQDVVQADYGHWLRRVARSRCGLFLQPTGDVPGDLLGARVPRRTPLRAGPGRGWLVQGGEATFAQALGPG